MILPRIPLPFGSVTLEIGLRPNCNSLDRLRSISMLFPVLLPSAPSKGSQLPECLLLCCQIKVEIHTFLLSFILSLVHLLGVDAVVLLSSDNSRLEKWGNKVATQ